jgi:hypothetical protein
MSIYHKTKDGTKMLISEMDNNHLLNTIRMLKKMAKEGITIKYGGGDSGCSDGYYYEEEELTGKEAKKHLNYKAYKQEAIKRGLIQ